MAALQEAWEEKYRESPRKTRVDDIDHQISRRQSYPSTRTRMRVLFRISCVFFVKPAVFLAYFTKSEKLFYFFVHTAEGNRLDTLSGICYTVLRLFFSGRCSGRCVFIR